MGTHHMSATDHAWLRMDQPGNLLVVNAVMWSSDPVDVALLRQVIGERMVDRFPRFRQRPGDGRIPPGRAEWVDDEQFALDRHVSELALPAPGDRAALQDYVSGQVAVPLDPSRPLWQLHIITGYRGGTATLFRMHHAVADGISLMRVMLALTDGGPVDGFEPVHDPGLLGSLAHVAESALSQGAGLARHPSRVPRLAAAGVRDAARLVHLATLPPVGESVLSGHVGAAKRVTWTAPIPLDDIKRIGHATGASVNDVLLAALAGCLAEYLPQRGTPLPDVRVMVPVNLRPLDGPLPAELGNEFGFMFVDLPTSPMDPAQRLAEMHRRVQALKGSPEALVTYGVLAGLGAAPKVIEDLGVAFFGSKAVGVVTNVPGPTRPVRLAGARVDGFVGWVPRGGDMGIGVAISSYAGGVTVGFSTDAGLIPDPERLQDLMLAQVEQLRGRSAGE